MGLFTDDASHIEVKAIFPDNNPMGVVVNGQQNQMILKFINSGTGNYTIVNAAASYHDVEKNWALVRNTSALKYNVPLPAGANFSVPFNVHSEFRPRDLGLTVWANLQDVQKDTHRFVALNSTVTVVEPQGSWFDLQALFMYIVVLATLGGLGYFAYNALMEYYYPQQKRTRSKRAGGKVAGSTADLKVVPAESGKPYPESVKPYEEDWVPSHHLKPAGGAARKRKGAKTGLDGGASSAAEVTSGGEGFTSGGESASEKKKAGKKGKRN